MKTPYISYMRGGDGNLYRGAWVQTDGAPLPFAHAWSSSRYDPDEDAAIIDIGEQRTESVTAPQIKTIPARICRGCFVGLQDWIETGTWPPGSPPVELAADGWPKQCEDGKMGVQSVGLVADPTFIVSGSPVTYIGSFSLNWALVPAGWALLGPTGGPDATPTFKPFPPVPLTLQPPSDAIPDLKLLQHSATQTAPLLEALTAGGLPIGAQITGGGQFSNPNPLTGAGIQNELFGSGAGVALTTGYGNAIVGHGAAAALNTGYRNTVLGDAALASGTSANQNTAIGYQSLNGLTVGYGNTAVGYKAVNAGGSSTYNCAFGYTAGYNITTGGSNTCVGASTLSNVTTQSGNTAVGSGAGSGFSSANCSFFGATADASGSGLTNSTALGYGAIVTASHQIMMGTSAETVVFPGLVDVMHLKGQSSPPPAPPAGSLALYSQGGLVYQRDAAGNILAVTSAIIPENATVTPSTTDTYVTLAEFGPATGIQGWINFKNTGLYTVRVQCTTDDPINGSQTGSNFFLAGSVLGAVNLVNGLSAFNPSITGTGPYSYIKLEILSNSVGLSTTLLAWWSVLLSP